jgi:segregation and condensation protein A
MEWNIAGHQARNYQVETPVFQGPLDLLLHLIERAELDITALSLAQVTDQYLAYIEQMRDQIGPEEISAFLVIAARLLQIKSEALLPRPPRREAGEESPGEALAEQLRLYKRFKELAEWLREREEAGLQTFLRLAPPPKLEKFLPPDQLSLADLLQAAMDAFGREQEKEALGTVITPPKVTIREKIKTIRAKLGRAPRTSFRELLSETPTRIEVVVTFLALLELVKRYRVVARQEGLFGEIIVERTELWCDDDEDLDLEFE